MIGFCAKGRTRAAALASPGAKCYDAGVQKHPRNADGKEFSVMKKKETKVAAEVKEAVEEVKKVVAEKAPAVKAEAEKVAAEVKKTAAKKAPAVKAEAEKVVAEVKKTAKKAAAVKKPNVKFVLQYAGKEVSCKDMMEQAKALWQGDMKEVVFYVKPEEDRVYFVVNGEPAGSFEI